eukprot:9585258-Heterocapsa_arctica.AAC.1
MSHNNTGPPNRRMPAPKCPDPEKISMKTFKASGLRGRGSLRWRGWCSKSSAVALTAERAAAGEAWAAGTRLREAGAVRRRSRLRSAGGSGVVSCISPPTWPTSTIFASGF